MYQSLWSKYPIAVVKVPIAVVKVPIVVVKVPIAVVKVPIVVAKVLIAVVRVAVDNVDYEDNVLFHFRVYPRVVGARPGVV